MNLDGRANAREARRIEWVRFCHRRDIECGCSNACEVSADFLNISWPSHRAPPGRYNDAAWQIDADGGGPLQCSSENRFVAALERAERAKSRREWLSIANRNWQITQRHEALAQNRQASAITISSRGKFSIDQFGLRSTGFGASGSAALKLPRLRSASVAKANRDCSSHGAYWTNLYRYNGKCTGRRYRHTHKRDPVLWELISRVLESPKRDEVPER